VELYAWRHYEERPREETPVVVPTPGAARPQALVSPSPSPSPTPRVRGEAKREREPVLLATGSKRFATENGVTYPVWDFNNVDVSYARTADQDRWLEMFVLVDGMKMDASPWIYGGENNKDWTEARTRPSESCR
jgi:hypothetical protein